MHWEIMASERGDVFIDDDEAAIAAAAAAAAVLPNIGLKAPAAEKGNLGSMKWCRPNPG